MQPRTRCTTMDYEAIQCAIIQSAIPRWTSSPSVTDRLPNDVVSKCTRSRVAEQVSVCNPASERNSFAVYHPTSGTDKDDGGRQKAW
ncbi:hypothetical protein [Novipirellula aureliae]|uniref:hypothetical protein n=1 Tax=Novipirellula aureliae TaxID=2527966 RepID=UPI0011B7C22D|nr:hypothetical protein [Novipirellula aureliae]